MSKAAELDIQFYHQNSLQMSQKTFFGGIDFRNAKFQGSIREGQMDGIGLVLDHEYLLALTNWKNDNPYGPSLVIYPSRDYFYGKIKNKKPQEICCFSKASGESLFFNFVNGVSDSLAYVDLKQNVIELALSNGKYRVVETHGAGGTGERGEEERWERVGQILKAEVGVEMRSYKAYVKGVLEKQFYDLIECSQSTGLTFIGFRNMPSLGVKMDRNGKVRQIGTFETFPRVMEFGRAFTDGSGKRVKIQEGKFGDNPKIFEFFGQRPAQALKYTEQFFKRGTNFKNTFMKFTAFEEMARYFDSIQDEISQLTILEYGQKILEQNSSRYDSKEQEKVTPIKDYTLEEVKQEIYAAVQRRNNPRKITTDRFSPPRLSPRNNDSPRYGNKLQIQVQDTPVEPLSHSRSKRHLKYKYTEEIHSTKDLHHVTDRRRTEYDLLPDVSDFDRRDRSPIAHKQSYDHLRKERTPERLYRYVNEELQYPERKFARQNEVNMERDYSPTPTGRPMPRRQEVPAKTPTKPNNVYTDSKYSPNKLLASVPADEPKFQNYLKYKNRNKQDERSLSRKKNVYEVPDHSNDSVKKYEIYERRVLGPRNQTPEKDPRSDKMGDPGSTDPQSVKGSDYMPAGMGRHRKNFKYLE